MSRLNLKAVSPDEEPEGFPVAEVDEWLVETVGMRASDVVGECGSKRLALLFAAAPDLLRVCESLLAGTQDISAARLAVWRARNG